MLSKQQDRFCQFLWKQWVKFCLLWFINRIDFVVKLQMQPHDAAQMQRKRETMDEKLENLLSRMEAEIAELREIGEEEYAEGIEYALKLIRSQLF